MSRQSRTSTRPRRSERLKDVRSEPSGLEQVSSLTVDGSIGGSCDIEADLLRLSPELRLQMYQYLVVDERPFMIGRHQEDSKSKTRGGPRDFFPGKHTVHRDDRPHRPIQPPITRVCRTLRKESLPLFYQDNRFWLIHNEFRADDYDAGKHQPRRFQPWLQQTPTDMFNAMQHVSLCGYGDWPIRYMITLDLKNRKLIGLKEYSTYGDQLPLESNDTEAVEEILKERLADDGLTALRAVLEKYDWMFDLQTEHISAPPGLSRTRKPMEGLEYEW